MRERRARPLGDPGAPRDRLGLGDHPERVAVGGERQRRAAHVQLPALLGLAGDDRREAAVLVGDHEAIADGGRVARLPADVDAPHDRGRRGAVRAEPDGDGARRGERRRDAGDGTPRPRARVQSPRDARCPTAALLSRGRLDEGLAQVLPRLDRQRAAHALADVARALVVGEPPRRDRGQPRRRRRPNAAAPGECGRERLGRERLRLLGLERAAREGAEHRVVVAVEEHAEGLGIVRAEQLVVGRHAHRHGLWRPALTSG